MHAGSAPPRSARRRARGDPVLGFAINCERAGLLAGIKTLAGARFREELSTYLLTTQ